MPPISSSAHASPTKLASKPSPSGKALLAQAEAKFNSSKKSSITWWISSLFSTRMSEEDNVEQAAELFGQAANRFKIDKLWNDAGSAFLRMATCSSIIGERDDELSALVSAASCFKKSEFPQKAIDPLTTASLGYLERGRLHTAARQFRDLGELYEILAGKPIESGDYFTPSSEPFFLKAIEFFQKSSDLFLGEDAIATSNACLIRVGMLAALCKDFPLAVRTFEEMARQSISQALAKWSVKEHLFRASLCMLASRDYDLTSIERAHTSEYITLDSGFSMSLECAFVAVFISSDFEDDLESFNAIVSEFDKMSPFDAWKSALLLLIKQRFDETESLA
ncbi:hypothetical protein DI09_25p80 [Mitosporidium daphniae]|uniref:Uncharacterized protein n=1 Tax=Mitosporidium daphniae TaxID=1485682 RepID=A0A098VS32_9MICR|nr:uncharacterized protein DI09_25p80 [Mitosporidium daphniae]KGG51848.1 hypothetical protein DI09_25p80 [Mitosporidium daphniae]|eukprot:XP_013238302.1 uncharacterized protein DI09_25p80 [Mitosporidium daphniae]